MENVVSDIKWENVDEIVVVATLAGLNTFQVAYMV